MLLAQRSQAQLVQNSPEHLVLYWVAYLLAADALALLHSSAAAGRALLLQKVLLLLVVEAASLLVVAACSARPRRP
jgi:hypothetical protein